ncbi:hypothetical protein BGZ83_004119 [Gryganskiella cystojenkinii]|nr:hypothetical protein BGZ83_004119 [Gryganskiella cystojenkinii]
MNSSEMQPPPPAVIQQHQPPPPPEEKTLKEVAKTPAPLPPKKETTEEVKMPSRPSSEEKTVVEEEKLKEPSQAPPPTLKETTTEEVKEPTFVKLPLKTQTFLLHEYSWTGLGNKFTDMMFSIQYARQNNLNYAFNPASFVANPRDADHIWMAELLEKRFTGPTTRQNRLHRIEDFTRPPPVLTDEERALTDGFLVDTGTACDRKDCFQIESSNWTAGLFTNNPELQDLLGVTTENRQRRVAIHLRFGDRFLFMTPQECLQVVKGLEKKYPPPPAPKKWWSWLSSSPSLVDQVDFVYHIPTEDERYEYTDDRQDIAKRQQLLDEMKAVFPRARFHDFRTLQKTVRFLAESEFLITSGSSLSYMAGYFCAGCHVVFTSPKEWRSKGLLMTKENYKQSLYYMEGWDPDFEFF